MHLSSNQNNSLRSILILALGLVWIWVSRVPPGSQDIGVIQAPHSGFLAPEFELPATDETLTSLRGLRGNVVVLNFWASWCPPCRAEMPALERVHQTYAARGVVILGVNAANQDTLAAAQTFITENGLTFPILYDLKGQAGSLYQVAALPSTFFIDRQGIIQEVVIGGPISASHLQISIEQLLKSAAQPPDRPEFRADSVAQMAFIFQPQTLTQLLAPVVQR